MSSTFQPKFSKNVLNRDKVVVFPAHGPIVNEKWQQSQTVPNNHTSYSIL